MISAALALTLFAGTPDVSDGRKLLLDCEKQFLRIESMRGTVRTRSVVHGGGREASAVTERRSDFTYARFDRIRWENTAPLEHTVVWNGKTLWVWSPRENAAVEEPASKVTPLSRAALSVQPGFGIDLLAPIPLDAYRASAAPPGESGEVVVTLEPIDSRAQSATMQLIVDPARRMVTRMMVKGEGTSLLSDVRFKKPVEAKPGIWIATQVESRQLLADGSTLEELKTFERLAFDVPVDESRFEMKVPADATRVSVESLRGSGSP